MCFGVPEVLSAVGQPTTIELAEVNGSAVDRPRPAQAAREQWSVANKPSAVEEEMSGDVVAHILHLHDHRAKVASHILIRVCF